jgi:HAD superfamily hydrolase (TIGR01509 family)
MIRGLLFDFDGLLVDTESPALAAWQHVYREHGHELPLDRWVTVIGTVGGFEPLDHLEELVGTPLERESLNQRRRAHELRLVELEQLRPGIADYLADAQRLGLKLAIVSSSSNRWIDSHLRRLEQAVAWDAIVAANGDAALAKPHPTLYLRALDQLGLEPDEAIAFEDSPNGVRAAQAAGIFCVGVPNPVTASLQLDADLALVSLADLPLEELLRTVDR